jgi:hypothetical protein
MVCSGWCNGLRKEALECSPYGFAWHATLLDPVSMAIDIAAVMDALRSIAIRQRSKSLNRTYWLSIGR